MLYLKPKSVKHTGYWCNVSIIVFIALKEGYCYLQNLHKSFKL